MKILVTNDDGPYSPGLWALARAADRHGETLVVVPETPKSASGLGITLHKPLRVQRLVMGGREVFLANGTPSDIVYVVLKRLEGSIGLVVSGINMGDNTSVQVVLSSGTVGAAAQAALLGIPSIAFSADKWSPEDFAEDYARWAEDVASAFIGTVAQRGLPRGVDLLNINLPSRPTGEAVVVGLAKMRFANLVEERRDPRGSVYYWLYGEPVSPEPGTDVYALKVEGRVTVTPISLRFEPAGLGETRRLVEEAMRRVGGGSRQGGPGGE